MNKGLVYLKVNSKHKRILLNISVHNEIHYLPTLIDQSSSCPKG